MSQQNHMASSCSSSMLHCCGRDQHEVLRYDYGVKEARLIMAESEHYGLAQILAQLQRKFNEFPQTVILPQPGTRSPGPRMLNCYYN